MIVIINIKIFYNILIDLTSVTANAGVIPAMTSFATTPQVGPESEGPVPLVAPPHCCVKIVFVSKVQFHIEVDAVVFAVPVI